MAVLSRAVLHAVVRNKSIPKRRYERKAGFFINTNNEEIRFLLYFSYHELTNLELLDEDDLTITDFEAFAGGGFASLDVKGTMKMLGGWVELDCFERFRC